MPFETEERVINLPPLISARDQPSLLQWCNPPERRKGYWTLYRGRSSQYHYKIRRAIEAWNRDHPDVRGPADLCAAGQLQARSLFEAVKFHLESDDGVHFWQALQFYSKRTEWKTVRISTVRCDKCEKDGLVGYLTRRHNTSGKTGVQCDVCKFRQHKMNEPTYWQCSFQDGSTSACGRIFCDDCRDDLLSDQRSVAGMAASSTSRAAPSRG